jgi:hypothetical protein
VSRLWNASEGTARDDSSSPQQKPLTAEEAESILNGLAGSYYKRDDMPGASGAIHHFFQCLPQGQTPEPQVLNLEAALPDLDRYLKLRSM